MEPRFHLQCEAAELNLLNLLNWLTNCYSRRSLWCQYAWCCLIPVCHVSLCRPFSNIIKIATQMRGWHVNSPLSKICTPSPKQGPKITGAHCRLPNAVYAMIYWIWLIHCLPKWEKKIGIRLLLFSLSLFSFLSLLLIHIKMTQSRVTPSLGCAWGRRWDGGMVAQLTKMHWITHVTRPIRMEEAIGRKSLGVRSFPNHIL